jgi:hypothetical protein
VGSNDHLHENTNFVPENKMGPDYRSDATGHVDTEHARHNIPAPPPFVIPMTFARPNNAMIGIGGAPTRATTLPTDPKARKTYPIASGLLDYFPDALAAVAHLSHVANEQHNPGQPVHWARGKSMDEWDTLMRHFLQRGTVDTDGIPHSVKIAWRALAALQKEIENGV